jgi:hypothetical protein
MRVRGREGFMHRSQLVLVLAALAVPIAPAIAQFPSLFDPPRPPSEVPGRPPARAPPPQPQVQPPPEPYAGPPSPFQPTAPRGGVQSQPLPPPPGATAAPPQPPVQQGTFAPPPAGPAAPGQPPPPPGAALQPGDEVVTAPPAVKVANPSAVFSGLDKITGRITTFEAAINETVEFGALRVTPRACYTRPPTEPQNTDGFLEVDEITLQGETRRIFTGWMFAASPGLHGVEHSIYDVWLTDCKGGDPTTVAGAKPPEPEPPPPPPRTKRR